MVSLEFQYTVNRIELTFPTEGAYRYIIEVAKTPDKWTKVVDQSESALMDQTRMAVGKFGEDITYVRVRFTSELAGLAEVRVGGSTKASQLDDTFLGGTLIGTQGSWDGNPYATKDAAMDFDTNTFFDGPNDGGPYWIGLDLGYGCEATVTSVAFMPRYNADSSNFAERMKGGRFQVADNPQFRNAKTIYTIHETPKYKTFTVAKTTNQQVKGRYVRYLSTDAGLGNVAELQFYGTINTPVTVTSLSGDADKISIHGTNGHIQVLGANPSERLQVSDLAGRMVYSGLSHDIMVLPHKVYVVKVGHASQLICMH